jgi:hypothetical protein
MKGHERTLWAVAVLYFLLAGTWAFAWEIFPHRPLHLTPRTRVRSGAYFDQREMRPIFPTRSQWCLILGLTTVGFGLLQTRWLKRVGAQPSAGVTSAFLFLMATAACGWWFLSFHRGGLEDRWPDPMVRSVALFFTRAAVPVAIANAAFAFARRRLSQPN